jgi:hypothetical protein
MTVTESQLVTQCLQFLKLHGVMHWRANQIPVPGRKFRGTRGVSDILAIMPGGKGRLWAIECKTEEGELSPYQEDWLNKLQAAGGYVTIVRDVADLEIVARNFGW